MNKINYYLVQYVNTKDKEDYTLIKCNNIKPTNEQIKDEIDNIKEIKQIINLKEI